MEIVKYVLIAFEVVASIALIVAVLLQSGKEAGLSGAIAGNNDSYMGKGKGNKLDKMLAASTKWIALAWLLLTLGLNLL
jgi:preprotein translocase subunit SecG